MSVIRRLETRGGPWRYKARNKYAPMVAKATSFSAFFCSVSSFLSTLPTFSARASSCLAYASLMPSSLVAIPISPNIVFEAILHVSDLGFFANSIRKFARMFENSCSLMEWATPSWHDTSIPSNRIWLSLTIDANRMLNALRRNANGETSWWRRMCPFQPVKLKLEVQCHLPNLHGKYRTTRRFAQ